MKLKVDDKVSMYFKWPATYAVVAMTQPGGDYSARLIQFVTATELTNCLD